MNPAQYINVDEVQARTTLEEAAALCGKTIDAQRSGTQCRLDCLFGCRGDHAGKREISVDTGNPQKVFCCHAYGCQIRGNLLMLMHGWLKGAPPAGGKLKGEDFRQVRDVLVGKAAIAGAAKPSPEPDVPESTPPKPARNIPLAESENERVRSLATLDEKFAVDFESMPPGAAAYLRRHPCLTPEIMRKWRIGALPADSGGDKRAWSLRGQLLYPVLSEEGHVLAFVARDPHWESRDIAFNALSPETRAKEKKPPKHRFPVDFHRGLELFGQQASRLKEPGYRETIAACGVIVVEGFNDVLGLDALGLPAVAMMSNRITVAQLSKIERWAKSLALGKVTILFDADDAGDEGAKESLWLLAQRGLDVRLGWSRAMHGGNFDGRQPESLTADEWQSAIRPAIER